MLLKVAKKAIYKIQAILPGVTTQLTLILDPLGTSALTWTHILTPLPQDFQQGKNDEKQILINVNQRLLEWAIEKLSANKI